MRPISRYTLLNGWLKYHNTTVEEIIKTLPEDTLKSPEWFSLYKVTQEQHDEWVKWAKDYVRKETKISKRLLDREWDLFIQIVHHP